MLNNIKENNDRLLQLLSPSLGAKDETAISIGQLSDGSFEAGEEAVGESRTIEGVFDGENMIGPDGKQYSVPANYASKSKLVEGDTLKLTITNNGRFIYKQIKPTERIRKVGALVKDPANDQWYVQAENKKYKVLTASITFYKSKPGDEVVFMVAKDIPNTWAAVDNIVKK